MPGDQPPSAPLNPWVMVIATYALLVFGVLVLERGASQLLAKQVAAGGALAADQAHGAAIFNAYLRLREWALGPGLPMAAFLLALPLLLFLAIKRISAALARWTAQTAEMEFRQERYDFARTDAYLPEHIAQNPAPAQQVFLGLQADGSPYYLTDKTRATHVHILGQTGSGKTKTALEPLAFQDMWRGRGVMLVDAKGSEENEDRFISMAAAVGRLQDVRVFTLNPRRRSHTYNPLHLAGGADPQAIAERVFSSFEHDMDNPFYKGQARMFFVSLVKALAATGKPFHLLDTVAATTSPDILHYALEQSSDGAAKREIYAQLAQLGKDAPKALTGLLEALKRYDHPALNVYAPDIVLEDVVDGNGLVAFMLPVNYYKQLARYVGVIVFQHLQQIGSLRQLDRRRPRTPLNVFCDEFYNFAYEGFTTSVNMLRDANIAIHIAHQSLSDLEKVSPEFASGIWDNTRTKIVLLQTNPELCEKLAKTLGTKKDIEMTLRRSADAFLNKTNMLEASTKEVDAYRLHPSRVKMLRTGQAYVTQDAEFLPLNLQFLPDLPPAVAPPPTGRDVPGLGLHARFVSETPNVEAAS